MNLRNSGQREKADAACTGHPLLGENSFQIRVQKYTLQSLEDVSYKFHYKKEAELRPLPLKIIFLFYFCFNCRSSSSFSLRSTSIRWFAAFNIPSRARHCA